MTDRYSTHKSIRGNATILRLEESDSIFAEVVPEWGNNCFLFHARFPVLEPVSFEEFAQRPRSYGIPILFPFPNRIKDGKFSFEGKTYRVNPTQHGYVRDKSWNIVDCGASASEGAWILSSFDATDYPEQILDQFPFPFRLQVHYRLRDSRLTMETTVKNTGSDPLPFGFGIHPYFRMPDAGTLGVPAQKRWELIDSIPTGKKIDLEAQYDLRHPRDIHSLSLDDIYTELQSNAENIVRCALRDNANQMATIVEFDANEFPEVVAYTPPAPRRAICIEPYTCPTDAFNLQNDGIPANVLRLQSNAQMKFTISIYALRIDISR